MTAAVIAFLVFAVSVSLSPGPNNLLIAASGSSQGFVRSVPAIVGVSVGFLLLLLIGASGAAALLTGHDRVVLGLKLVGSGYLLYLAWKLAGARGAIVVPKAGAGTGGDGADGGDGRDGGDGADGRDGGDGGDVAPGAAGRPVATERSWRIGFWHMLALQFANPKGWAMALSTIVTFRPSFPSGWASFALICALFTAVNLASNSTWALLGQGIGSRLDRPSRVRAFNLTAGVLLAASVVTILL